MMFSRFASRLATFGLALALSGCGFKEAADAPPLAATAPPVAVATAESSAPAKPTGPTKTLKLIADSASTEQLTRTVAILNERLRLAEIPGEAKLDGNRILVTLQDDKSVLERAANLLLAGGELLFYALVTETQMPNQDIQKHIDEVKKAKDDGTYDRAKATYDISVGKDDGKLSLMENPPVPGYLLSYVAASTDENGKPSIAFEMTKAGSDEFFAFTSKHLQRQEAIVFDGKLILAPTIMSPIEGSGVITGDFTQQEVDDMVTILKSGRLPIELNLEAE